MSIKGVVIIDPGYLGGRYLQIYLKVSAARFRTSWGFGNPA